MFCEQLILDLRAVTVRNHRVPPTLREIDVDQFHALLLGCGFPFGGAAVSSYLTLAQRILLDVRRPMTPRQMMNHAYKNALVPVHLHGRTQFKTLQARLSEDILAKRDDSAFFRTEPGKFFLREFITDESIPSEYRTPILARRRLRELPQRNALALNISGEKLLKEGAVELPKEIVEKSIRECSYHYVESVRDRQRDDAIVWSYVVVSKGSKVLSYRHGRYREGRDAFLEKRSIGFYTMVVSSDLSLFDQMDHGILQSGVQAVSVDLDLPKEVISTGEKVASLEAFLVADDSGRRDLLALIDFQCPNWFEPLNKRLSINDLHWLDLSSPPNDIFDFDPWSQLALGRIRSAADERS